MKYGLSVFALSCLALATQASAQAEGGETATENVAVEEVDDPSQRIRCRTRRVTGSNARRVRICMTLAEWEEMYTSGNRDTRDVYDRSRVNSCAAVNCPN
ncbi:hypothetical protein DFR46_2291 [Parasphingopyxis lamellibrachiae]|uniref:Secreted protein n=1 Tax=Parasphingopyxis lamellibrachiae TaxID=680125 RepID=A0A3D9FI59_9SPHN|nr:hypothetical protein DFR46_2291 [Parasphingopyxis lamellibrachiae]